MKINIEKNNIKEKAAKALESMIGDVNDRPLLLLLSGGSSFGLLDHIAPDSFTKDTVIGMLDDRYSRDPEINGCQILKRTAFFSNAVNQGVIFLDSSVGESESLDTYADRYESEIKKWMKLYPDGIIRATVGIGPDGHTSGVLPYPEDPKKFNELFNGEHLVAGYDVGDKSPYRYRLTSTFTLMRKFDRVITYMTGEGKREALKKVLADDGTLAETPGRIIRELKDVEVYTDIVI